MNITFDLKYIFSNIFLHIILAYVLDAQKNRLFELKTS